MDAPGSGNGEIPAVLRDAARGAIRRTATASLRISAGRGGERKEEGFDDEPRGDLCGDEAGPRNTAGIYFPTKRRAIKKAPKPGPLLLLLALVRAPKDLLLFLRRRLFLSGGLLGCVLHRNDLLSKSATVKIAV